MRSRKYSGAPSRGWLARWLKVGKSRRLQAETQAEALAIAYRHKLVDELQQRTFAVLNVAKPLDLEKSYVPLRVSVKSEEPHPRGRESEVAQRDDERASFRAMSPEEALIRFRHLAVLGDPGAGKTTMLRYLTLLAAQGRLENLPNFPILVSLDHFAAVPQIHLLEFIADEIEDRYGFPGLRPYLEERLEEGSVLFLLDGLSEATHRHVVGPINVMAARYPNCPMIVTATTHFRRGDWKGLLAASFHTAEVLGFNKDDIQRFIVNWFDVGFDRARALRDTLFETPHMWTLAANPLLLSLMAFAFEQDGRLPEGRGGLYSRGVELLLKPCYELVLSRACPEPFDPSTLLRAGIAQDKLRRRVEGHSRRERDLKRAHFLTIEHERSLLEEIALRFHLQRALLFPEDELKEVIAGYLPTIPNLSKGNNERSPLDIPSAQVSTVLEEISGQHGLLGEQVVGWVGFHHPTWQEYLAAAAISRRGQLEWVLESLHDPWWQGTALFLAGVSEDATPFLEGILAQEEDIFHSNLLLAGRCLASVSCVEGSAGDLCLSEDIIERLKNLVEGRHHRLLQRQAVGVLAEIGGKAVVSFLAALLHRDEIDPNVHAEIVKALGSLHEKSAVPDLLAFLTDEKMDPSVRRNIAEALGSLGDESVTPSLLALLSDETVAPFVRGRVAEALSALGDESVLSPLLALLPDERIDPYVRQRISSAILGLSLSSILHPPVVSRLLPLLPDEGIRPSVRRGIVEAVGSLGDESAVPDLLALLSDERVDPSVRGKAAESFGILGAESAVPPLLAILGDERVNYSVRMTVAEVLGSMGDQSVAFRLLALLSDEKIDPDVRASIAGALGILGEKSVVPQLLSLLPDERIDPAVRWRIVDALSSLSEKTIIPHLQALLPNENIDSSVRWVVAEALEALAGETKESGEGRIEEWKPEEALGSLDDRSRVPQLLVLLKDKSLDPTVSRRIIEALGSLGDDRATVEGLAALLDREDIGPHAYKALFHVSQRAGMRVFARKDGGYEIRPI